MVIISAIVDFFSERQARRTWQGRMTYLSELRSLWGGPNGTIDTWFASPPPPNGRNERLDVRFCLKVAAFPLYYKRNNILSWFKRKNVVYVQVIQEKRFTQKTQSIMNSFRVFSNLYWAFGPERDNIKSPCRRSPLVWDSVWGCRK